MADNYLQLLQESVEEKYKIRLKAISHESYREQICIESITEYPLSFLPYLIWKSLPLQYHHKITLSKVHALCFAAHCEWKGFIQNYSFSFNGALHNFFSHESYTHYLSLASESDWQSYIKKSYTARFKSLIQLQSHYSYVFYNYTHIVPLYASKELIVDKAQGILISVPLLFSSFLTSEDEKINDLMEFIQHIVTSYTLVHDLYCWQTHISQGYISPIISHMLSSYHRSYARELDQPSTTILKHLFWSTSLDHALTDIIYHIEQSTYLLQASTLIEDPRDFLKLIKRLLYEIKKLQSQQETHIQKASLCLPTEDLIQSPYMW